MRSAEALLGRVARGLPAQGRDFELRRQERRLRRIGLGERLAQRGVDRAERRLVARVAPSGVREGRLDLRKPGEGVRLLLVFFDGGVVGEAAEVRGGMGPGRLGRRQPALRLERRRRERASDWRAAIPASST